MPGTENSKVRSSRERLDSEISTTSWELQERRPIISDSATTICSRETRTLRPRLTPSSPTATSFKLRTETSTLSWRDSCRQTSKSEPPSTEGIESITSERELSTKSAGPRLNSTEPLPREEDEPPDSFRFPCANNYFINLSTFTRIFYLAPQLLVTIALFGQIE